MYLFSSHYHRSEYLSDTDTLDRAKSHLAALQKAELQGKMPVKLAITIKPLVIDKEDSQFMAEWNSAITEAERSLMKTLQSHLTR